MNQLVILRKLPAMIGILLLLLSGCSSVRLVSDYDEITDHTVTNLQEKVATFFVKLEGTIGTKAAAYQNHIEFYQSAKVDLNTLKIRADAFGKNRIVQEQVVELTKMIDNLEKLHKIGFESIELVRPLHQPFNAAFTAIVKFQLGLKRGN